MFLNNFGKRLLALFLSLKNVFIYFYSRSLLVIYFKYSGVHMSIPNSQSIPPPFFLLSPRHPNFFVKSLMI